MSNSDELSQGYEDAGTPGDIDRVKVDIQLAILSALERIEKLLEQKGEG